MKFHFKITAWEEVIVPNEEQDKVLQGIKSGSIKRSDDIFLIMMDNKELEYRIYPGIVTIQVLTDDYNILWDNVEGDYAKAHHKTDNEKSQE